MATLDDFARMADQVAATTSKREKVRLLSGFLRDLAGADLVLGTRYATGTVFAVGDPRTLQVGGAAFQNVLQEVGGVGPAELAGIWRRHADIGRVTGDVLRMSARSAEPLTLQALDAAFAAMAAASGARAKTAALRELLSSTTPDAGRYVAKLISGEMRIGLREGLVEEAIGVAFDAPAAAVSRAVMLVGDLAEVAALAAAGRLDSAEPRWFVPLRFMLATPVMDAQEAVARMGEDVWVEDKYDGIRCQLHRSAGRVELYSRDLKNVTRQFPEVAAAAAELQRDVILDGEVLAFHDGRVMPFQALQTRLGRVSPDAALMAQVPVVYVAWDVLVDGADVLLDAPLRERRARLEAMGAHERIVLAHLESVHGAAEVDRRFDDARARLNEGLMLKRPDSPYTPGRRGLSWLKLKRPLDTLDVVVIGAEWGHGKRRGVLSDVTFAVRVDETDELVPIGKAYSGLTDAEIAEMTQLLLDITTADRGHYRSVQPQIVLEVAFDAVRASNRHRSGYALRFPRIARWRHDKSVGDIDTLSRVRALAAVRSMEKEQRVDQDTAV
ncbi:MAG: ATP-dependent DNA ligase [Candidatus Dormibacteraeota bacterium]|nr:ATP-dependent DNA ligase [Candidatus Dormibacteraeota bacterium]